MLNRIAGLLSTPSFWAGVFVGAVDASFIWLAVLIAKEVL